MTPDRLLAAWTHIHARNPEVAMLLLELLEIQLGFPGPGRRSLADVLAAHTLAVKAIRGHSAEARGALDLLIDGARGAERAEVQS